MCAVLFVAILAGRMYNSTVPTPATTVPTPTAVMTVATTAPLTDPALTGKLEF